MSETSKSLQVLVVVVVVAHAMGNDVDSTVVLAVMMWDP
jgi:hypothetical protein